MKILCEGNNPFHFPNEDNIVKRKNKINNNILMPNPLSFPSLVRETQVENVLISLPGRKPKLGISFAI